jgi:LPXTG-motif cell wall-anchored protein
MSAGFYPGAPTALLRDVAARRTLRPSGGGWCGIAPGASGLSGMLLLGLFGLFLWRRRQ